MAHLALRVRAPGGLARLGLPSKDDSLQYPFQRALVRSFVSTNNETTHIWIIGNPANSAFSG